ncbi:hypothetical protein ACPCTG_31645 [Streptomyces pseudogriseolus]|uniref:hypothetical protein n=1 Tax=Streptomyces pseudogriseolus TaxID=36817 RepID=UPI003FA1C36B
MTHPGIPLGHTIPAHRAFGWCAHCPDHTVAEELAAWQTREPIDVSPGPAAEIDRLRTENGRMRHELEVMYGGAFDKLPEPAAVSAAVAPPTQAVLRDFLWRLEQSAGDAAAEKFLDDNPELRRAAAVPSAGQAPATNPRHGLSVQHADALWDAVATPGPRTATYPEQHERVCRTVARIIDDITAGHTAGDPAATLREQAERLSTKANKLTENLHNLAYFVAKDRLREAEILDREAAELRRLADETPDTQTPSMRLARQSVQAMADTLQRACPPGCVACATDESHDPAPAAGARQEATATDEPAPGSTGHRPCRTFVSGGTVWCCEEGETDCPCVCHQPAAGARQDGDQT